jgi:hypothetical protein
MRSYPQVLQVQDKTLVLYCGNEFGRYGFGVAELEFVE